jgi:hypothetical protein
VWSVPNEGKRNIKRLMRMGLLPGIPDLHFAWPTGNFGVIEMKAPGKKPSPEQRTRLEWFTANGFKAGWTSTFEGFQEIVRSWHG